MIAGMRWLMLIVEKRCSHIDGNYMYLIKGCEQIGYRCFDPELSFILNIIKQLAKFGFIKILKQFLRDEFQYEVVEHA